MKRNKNNKVEVEKFFEWHFGETKEECDKLFELVLTGRKTATSCLYFPSEKDPKYSILTNWDKSQKILLKTVEVRVDEYKNATSSHAFKEGEGSRSLREWKQIHKEFFEKRCKIHGVNFSPETLICYEIFEVVKVFKENNGI